MDSDVFGQRLDLDGNGIGPEFMANIYLGTEQDDPLVVSAADGRFAVAWSNWARSLGIYAQRYDATGSPLGVLPW
jgi:hypothetical protein